MGICVLPASPRKNTTWPREASYAIAAKLLGEGPAGDGFDQPTPLKVMLSAFAEIGATSSGNRSHLPAAARELQESIRSL